MEEGKVPDPEIERRLKALEDGRAADQRSSTSATSGGSRPQVFPLDSQGEFDEKKVWVSRFGCRMTKEVMEECAAEFFGRHAQTCG